VPDGSALADPVEGCRRGHTASAAMPSAMMATDPVHNLRHAGRGSIQPEGRGSAELPSDDPTGRSRSWWMRLADVPEPETGPSQVLVELHHVSLNHGDLDDARPGRVAAGGVLESDAAGVVVQAAADGTGGPAAGARLVALAPGRLPSASRSRSGRWPRSRPRLIWPRRRRSRSPALPRCGR